MKAFNTRADARFGHSVTLSGDTLVVGAYDESGGATGIDGPPLPMSAGQSGAAYVFVRRGSTWSQQGYIKATNSRASARFGYSVALSGETLAVGSLGETSDATGIDGSQAAGSGTTVGAVYVFMRTGTTWRQQAYVKASNARQRSNFGFSVALAGDTLAVGAPEESSAATGIDGNQADTSILNAGAAYVFVRSGTVWSQQAYVKASNTRGDAFFGWSVAVSGDTLAVGSPTETSPSSGVNGAQAASSPSGAKPGAVYVFTRTTATWAQQAYVKASNPGYDALFGGAVALVGDTLAIGSPSEASGATGVNGTVGGSAALGSGAAYLFSRRGGTWSQLAHVKASNPYPNYKFGYGIALSGDTLAVGCVQEQSRATGINGNQADTSQVQAGAAYVLR